MSDELRQERSGWNLERWVAYAGGGVPPPEAGPGEASGQMLAETAAAEGHLSRAEVKANLYVVVFGGAAIGVASAITQWWHLPAVAAGSAWLGVVCFATAAGLAAWAVRPSTRTRSGHLYGIALYAQLQVTDIPAAVRKAYTEPEVARKLVDASVNAMGKYAGLRRAIVVAYVGATWLIGAAVGFLLQQEGIL